MSDLLEVLPNFDLKPYSHLLHSLEKNGYTVADLVTFDPAEIAKECPLPLSGVRSLAGAVIHELQKDINLTVTDIRTGNPVTPRAKPAAVPVQRNALGINADIIKTLDPVLDDALGGGFHTGHITEIAGESSVGKTQFVLGLLLSSQLSPPQGLARGTMYISTESPLNTKRLLQILTTNPTYTSLDPSNRPSLGRVLCIPVNDVEAQEHIIEFQVPLAVQQHGIGLIVVDSIAANYRAEYETKTRDGLAERAWDLGRLGKILRTIAVDENVAVIVTNQVSDRFDDSTQRLTPDLARYSSSPTSSSTSMQQIRRARAVENLATVTRNDQAMSLDHQQRFFTGWGSDPAIQREDMKTPALGLVWANQISARIVLKMEGGPIYSGGNIWHDRKRRRFLSVIFAPWVEATQKPVEYEIKMEGVTSISEKALEDPVGIDPALLDPSLWGFDDGDDEEYP